MLTPRQEARRVDSLGEEADIPAGRDTPTQRRPLRQIFPQVAEAEVLSPTKRRRRSLLEDGPASLLEEPVKPVCPARPEERSLLHTAEAMQAGNALHEVLARLGRRDILEVAAPVCKAWRDVAHGEDLWAILRRRVRLMEQLVAVEKVVERRSKGKLFRCRRLGTGEPALLRIVNLELTNAGKDDGVPASFLREAALLKTLQHPNVIKFYGAEVQGPRGPGSLAAPQALICTEFVLESFATWHRRLDGRPQCEKLVDIRIKHRQLLTALSFIHHQGIMHRNLKPDNIFLDQAGTVKLGDFTTTRMLDVPCQAYTPEDPKERDRSGREMRRLWYHAPEVLLREDVYGPKVDVWAVGCLLAEAATGKQLFPSDSEIDHLFRTFRLMGTPTPATWPEVLLMKGFSPKFPMYPGFNLAQVTRGTCCGSVKDLESVHRLAEPDLVDVLHNVQAAAAVLRFDGMCLLDGMLRMQPDARTSAADALNFPFFGSVVRDVPSNTDDNALMHPVTARWLHGESTVGSSGDKLPQDGPRADALPEMLGNLSAPDVTSCGGASTPQIPAPLGSTKIPAQMSLSMLRVMQRRERSSDEAGRGRSCPRLPPGFDPDTRVALMDSVVRLAGAMSLTDHTLHIAGCIADRFLEEETGPVGSDFIPVLGATCLKIADVFAEQSKEYYKQENALEYSEAALGDVSAEQILLFEKELLPRLDFDVRLPNVHWFLQCFLAYGRFAPGLAVRIASFVADLALLDYGLLAYAPSLRAQCVLVLAAFLASVTTERGGRVRAVRTDEACLKCLAHWDEHVRGEVCRSNVAIDTTLCLQRMVRVLDEKRREWKGLRHTSVEAKHQGLANTIAYPKAFPIAKLVRYILPDCQRAS